MSRTEVMKFNKRWNDKDRAILEGMLDQFDAATFTPSTGTFAAHIRVHNSEGEHVLDIAKGTLYMKGGRTWPGSELYKPGTDNPDHIYRLSTHQAGGGNGKSEPEPVACPKCNMVHPADAGCDW